MFFHVRLKVELLDFLFFFTQKKKKKEREKKKKKRGIRPHVKFSYHGYHRALLVR